MHKIKRMVLTLLGLPLVAMGPLAQWVSKRVREKIQNDPNSVPEEIRRSVHFCDLDKRAYAALQEGDLVNATDLAYELLRCARDFKDHWNYGNALHHANIILGMVALKYQNTIKATEFLHKAGKTPGSPQLNTIGPSMCLALELLRLEQQPAVLDYLNQIAVFWELGEESIARWKTKVNQGEVPEDWQRLNY